MHSPRQAALFLLLAGAVAVQALVYVQLWEAARRADDFTALDYVAFYAAGRVAERHGFSEVYNLDRQFAEERRVREQVTAPLPYNHPPPLLPLLRATATDDYRASYVRWACCLLFFLACSLPPFYLTLRSAGQSRAVSAIAAACVFCFYPAFVSILKGQDTTFVLSSLAACAWALRQRRDAAAGLLLSLATVKPHVALLLAVPFVFARRKVWWGFCVGCLALAAYSLLLVGLGGARGFVSLLLLTAGGDHFGVNARAMINLMGLLLRSGVSPPAARLAAWAFYVLTALALCRYWRAKGDAVGFTHFCAAVPLVLFASPHLHAHDLALLALPCVALARALKRPWGVSAVPLTSLLLLAGATLPEAYRLSVSYFVIVALPSLIYLATRGAAGSSGAAPTPDPDGFAGAVRPGAP